MGSDLVAVQVDDRTSATLNELQRRVLNRALREVGREYAERVLADARAGLHHVTGFTAANLRVRLRSRRGLITFLVAPDRTTAWYAYCIENGHIAGQVRNRRHVRRTAQQIADLKEFGKWVPARPFMGPAAAKNLPSYPQAVATRVDELVAETIR